MSDKTNNPFLLNMDFSKPVCLKPNDQTWVSSPEDGVARVHLERVAEETGHVTSFVTFSPGSSFSQHTHTQGEELLILEGVFSDENGDYPAGTYIRNPPGSFHTPFTKEGCKLFVKLEQFKKGDNQQVVIKSEDQQWEHNLDDHNLLPLHEFGTENSVLVSLQKNEAFQSHKQLSGEEIIVISGTLIDEHNEYPTGTWIRRPHPSKYFASAEEETLIYVKTGCL